MRFKISCKANDSLRETTPEKIYIGAIKDSMRRQLSNDIVEKMEITKDPESWTNPRGYFIEGYIFSTKTMNEMLLKVSEYLHFIRKMSEFERRGVVAIIKSYENRL